MKPKTRELIVNELIASPLTIVYIFTKGIDTNNAEEVVRWGHELAAHYLRSDWATVPEEELRKRIKALFQDLTDRL
jgi:hypothetical protein